jgi:putative colanic acid biosynthesis acetyltransferase WcaF
LKTDRPVELQIADNRRAEKYTHEEQFRRLLWMFGQFLVRFSPRPCFVWRRFVLRCFGATIGAHVNIYPTTRIYFPWNLKVGEWSAIGEDVLVYNLGKVIIGSHATISHRAHLCAGTHDYRIPSLPLLKLPIVIGPRAWVCADAFVGPNVSVGEGAIVGARGVVIKNVAPWTIVAGNPARIIKVREMREK